MFGVMSLLRLGYMVGKGILHFYGQISMLLEISDTVWFLFIIKLKRRHTQSQFPISTIWIEEYEASEKLSLFSDKMLQNERRNQPKETWLYSNW